MKKNLHFTAPRTRGAKLVQAGVAIAWRKCCRRVAVDRWIGSIRRSIDVLSCQAPYLIQPEPRSNEKAWLSITQSQVDYPKRVTRAGRSPWSSTWSGEQALGMRNSRSICPKATGHPGWMPSSKANKYCKLTFEVGPTEVGQSCIESTWRRRMMSTPITSSFLVEVTDDQNRVLYLEGCQI